MTYHEFLCWCVYREKYGSLHTGMRIDRAVSRGIAQYLNSISKGKKFKPMEFSPHDVNAAKVDVNDPDAMLAALKGLSNGELRDADS